MVYLIFLRKLGYSLHITFVCYNNKRLARKKRNDYFHTIDVAPPSPWHCFPQFHLLKLRPTTSGIQKVESSTNKQHIDLNCDPS